MCEVMQVASSTGRGTASLVKSLAERLGVQRPELRAWAMYDWANSAVVTSIIATIFPIYFARVAGAELAEGVATQRFAVATFLAMLSLVILAPLLGVLADQRPIKKKLLGFFLAVGALAISGMYFIGAGDWLFALGLFFVAELSVASTFVFYDALLPHIASPRELDRVSTTGYALGYLGGGLLLALNLAWIEYPQWFGLPHGADLSSEEATLPTRVAFLSVALWWTLFSLPLFFRIKEPELDSAVATNLRVALRQSWQQVKSTAAALKRYPQAGRMLIAFLLYNEGIGTIIKLAAIYGAELRLDSTAMVGSILMVQFVGIPCTLLFGSLAAKIGAKRSIYLGLAVYLVIAVVAFLMKTERQFFGLAVLIALVQGGTQALSRSLYSSLIPKRESGRFFSLFALSEKLAGLLGPGLFVATIWLTGSSRYAIASVVVFFLAGGALLGRVNVDQGQSAVTS
jgi:UMF1 family MFS transporter